MWFAYEPQQVRDKQQESVGARTIGLVGPAQHEPGHDGDAGGDTVYTFHSPPTGSTP
jgi:hypothetical protein